MAVLEPTFAILAFAECVLEAWLTKVNYLASPKPVGKYMTTDPLADLLTRIRNALASKHKSVSVPFSSTKENIVKLMIKNGYLKDYQTEGKAPHLNLIIKLKYKAKVSKITSLTRLSKPGVRVYGNVKELPKLMRGRGILIISTPKGIMTGKEALQQNLGGELICKIT